MKNSLKKLKERFQAWRLARNRALFLKLLGQPESGVAKLCREAAEHIAVDHVQKWLDAKRIAHCKACVRTDQLVRDGDGYKCPVHKEKKTEAKVGA